MGRKEEQKQIAADYLAKNLGKTAYGTFGINSYISGMIIGAEYDECIDDVFVLISYFDAPTHMVGIENVLKNAASIDYKPSIQSPLIRYAWWFVRRLVIIED